MKFLFIFVWISLFNLMEAFLFTITKNNALGSCQPNFLCPPMCLKSTPTGCQCDCSNMDPSHPEHLGGSPNQQPNSAGYGVQNGGGCNTNWMNCQAPCAAAVNPTSGCVECNCPQVITTQPSIVQSSTISTMTSSKQPTTSPPLTTQFKTSQSTTTSSPPSSTSIPVTTSKTSTAPITSKTASSARTPISTTSSSSSMTTSTANSCQGAIQCIMSCKNGFIIDPIPAPDGCPKCTCKTAAATTTVNNTPSTPFQTVSFPVHLTTPHLTMTPPTTTTRPSSTTLHRIVCPGVFNCSKTCYTGYRLDSQGCPLCECAPMPTGLP
uniref:Mucin-5AC-like isoform X2 n=1 Tax=Crassostrea virginica TaxID=6565 RepID=A0A8B8C9J5_CRAVI|nr:mucin-5AC-like isoform X2 [Crassostrea virginica]